MQHTPAQPYQPTIPTYCNLKTSGNGWINTNFPYFDTCMQFIIFYGFILHIFLQQWSVSPLKLQQKGPEAYLKINFILSIYLYIYIYLYSIYL